ncbi:MAG: peptidylprolyl isomerase [Christensenellaceae bacterium]|nr:peptidylprolyl isomerase [Christensenellaceae bacterium]
MSLSKRIFIIIICVLTVFSSGFAIIAGIAGKAEADAKSPTSKKTVAKVNNEKIPYSEFYELLDYYMASWYGVTGEYLDSYFGAEYGNEIRESVIEELIDKHIALQNAGEFGLDKLGSEELAEVESLVQSFYSDTYDSVTENVTMEYTDEDGIFLLSDEEFQNEVESQVSLFLEENGYTDEYLHEYYTEYIKINTIYQRVIENVEVSDDMILEYYNKLMEEQKAEAENDEASALMMYDNGYYDVNVYIPGEIKYVQHILIQLPEEDLEELASIEDETKYDKALAEKLETLRPEAEEVLTKLKNGADFYELMEEYSDDEFKNEEPYKTNGYAVYPGAGYVESFEEESMKLSVVGQTTGLVGSDYGFHIIRLVKIVQPGEIPLEDVREEIAELALYEAQAAAWEEKLTAWRADAKIKKYEDRYLSAIVETEESDAALSEELVG